MALLALGVNGKAAHPRVREGVRVLRDRAIPGGGWNVGNTVVFGTTLRPQPATTGLALLALAAVDGPSDVIEPALAHLRDALAGTLAPISIGWGALGLQAWGSAPTWLPDRLAEANGRALARGLGPVELALLLMASGARTLELLGIAPRREAPTHA